MDSLKKLQAKVTQLKQSATNLTHKKSLSTSSKKSHDKTVRHSRSMPLDPVSLEPEVWIAQPRAQYKGKTPLKTSDIRVITRPQDQKIPPYAPLMVRDVEPEEEEYSDEDWYAGPTPPPKDIVYLFPAPPKTIPKPTSKEPSPRPSTKQVSPKPVVPASAPISSPPRIPKPVDSPLHKEDLLPPPPKVMFDKMQRQAERRRPKNPLGPLQTAPSWEEVEDFVMRSEPSSRPTSPQVDLDRDRLREALRRRKTQATQRQRPGHLPTPSSSSAGSVTTAPLEIRRTRSTGASAALSPRSKGTAGDGDPSTQGTGTEMAMTRNYSDTTSTPPLRVGASRKVDHDTPGFDVFGPMSTPLLLRPLSPPASPPSSPPPSFNSTHRRAQTTERIQLKEVKHYQGFGGTQPESPGPRYKLDSSSSSIILDRSTSSSGRSSATRGMRHYPTPSNSSGSSFCSSGDYQRDASSGSVLPPSPPPKKKAGLPLGAHTMSSAYRSAVPDIGFMSPADRVATTTTAGASTVSHRRANTADRLPLTRRF